MLLHKFHTNPCYYILCYNIIPDITSKIIIKQGAIKQSYICISCYFHQLRGKKTVTSMDNRKHKSVSLKTMGNIVATEAADRQYHSICSLFGSNVLNQPILTSMLQLDCTVEVSLL